MTFLNDLNKAQREAVEFISGPSLVIAGAGSGKTRVLTYKIAYLLSKGMKPWNIMALTFTNKAAREMKERIGRLVGTSLASHLYMGTFHSIFSRILRAEAQHVGFTSNFTIYDEADSRSLLKTIIKEMGLDDKVYKPNAVHARISMAKNCLMGPESYINDSDNYQHDMRANMPSVGKVYAAYVQRCRQANAMDFDDLLVLTFLLFRDHEDIRRKYADRFEFILVDEYQDTNHVQMNIVMQLCQDRQRICAVGDDSQSIYSFRGANIDNILNFRRNFDDAKLFKLEQNYRSTQNIVNAANSLIKHNTNQIPKEVYSKNAEGEKIVYKPAYSDREETLIVVKDIERIKSREDCEYSDFAILYRTNAQSRSFEEELRKRGIPYRIYGGLSFYQRKEVKDVMAYLRLVANPDDEEAFKRIINYPARGIGNTTVSKIAACAHTGATSLWQVVSAPAAYGLDVNRGTLAKLEQFRVLIESLIERAKTQNIFEVGDAIVKESGISKDIFDGKRDAESITRQQNIEELIGGMQEFVEDRREEGREDDIYLSDYLQTISLVTDQDNKDEDSSPRVSLMTVHAAKGLEFKTVFVVGLEENIFPNAIAAASLRELEEERRLLYVAITRAEEHCILTSAQSRWRYGKMEFDNPSRFIDEIDPALIDDQGETARLRDTDEPEYSATEKWRMAIFGDSTPASSPSDNNRRSTYASHPAPRQERTSITPDRPSTKHAVPGNFKSVRGVEAARRIMHTASAASVSPSASATPLHEGNKIEHQRFGIGTVVRIEGSGENCKATVQFANSGTKQLLLKFAKYRVIE